MLLCDINVLVYAHRSDASDHDAYRSWLEDVINSQAAYGVNDVVLSGFLRIVTHPRIFNPPSRFEDALTFAEQVRNQANAVLLQPSHRHWEIFTELCTAANVKGNLIADAFFAALAIESGSEWITTDRDFSRFPNLVWRHPLDS